MALIKYLEDKFELKILCKPEEKQKDDKSAQKDKEIAEPNVYWPIEVLPETKYTKNKDLKSLSEAEKISKKDYSTIKPKRLINILNSIDIELISKITAKDLIEYDGYKIPQCISHAQNHNRGLLNWMIKDFETKYIFKMLAYSNVLKNYNLINICMKALQGRGLSNKRISRLLDYKKILDAQEGGIFPFDWIFKDCADSNLNVESEIASVRFCKIVDKLKEMKLIKIEYVLRERERYFIYYKCWENLNSKFTMTESKSEYNKNFYLIL